MIVDDRETLGRLAEWLRTRGRKLKEQIWFRDADTAEKLDLVLFIGLAKGTRPYTIAARADTPRVPSS